MENKCIGFFQAKKLTIKWHLSENLALQNLFKNRKVLPAEKFKNVLTFDMNLKQSYTHLYQQTVLLKTIYIMTF